MKTIALDIGNVCILLGYEKFAGKVNLDAIPPELISLQREMECGRIDDGEFFDAAENILLLPRAECIDMFNSILTAPVPGMEELVGSLFGMGIKPVFFSDISRTHLQRTREIFPAASLVTDGIFSFEAGGQKPSEAMFAAFESRFGVPALYTDDRAELIAAAEKRGWHAVQFSSAAALKLELQRL